MLLLLPPLRGGGANDCLATVPRLAVLPKRLAPLIPGSRPSSRVLRGCMSGVAPPCEKLVMCVRPSMSLAMLPCVSLCCPCPCPCAAWSVWLCLPLASHRRVTLRCARRGDQATILSCNATTGHAAGGGSGTPPTHSRGVGPLELVIECTCREWPLCESAQVAEWPRHLCWCFRQCRSPKSCVMVGRCATYSRPLGWRARNPSGRP